MQDDHDDQNQSQKSQSNFSKLSEDDLSISSHQNKTHSPQTVILAISNNGSSSGGSSARDMSDHPPTTGASGEDASHEPTIGELQEQAYIQEVPHKIQEVNNSMPVNLLTKEFEKPIFRTQLDKSKQTQNHIKFVRKGVIKRQKINNSPHSHQAPQSSQKQQPSKYDDGPPENSHNRTKSYIILEQQNQKLKQQNARLTQLNEELAFKNSIGSSNSISSSDGLSVKVLQKRLQEMNQQFKEHKSIVKQISVKVFEKVQSKQKEKQKQKHAMSLNSPKFLEDQQYKKLSVQTAKYQAKPEQRQQSTRKTETFVSVYSEKLTNQREQQMSQQKYRSIYSDHQSDEQDQQEEKPLNNQQPSKNTKQHSTNKNSKKQQQQTKLKNQSTAQTNSSLLQNAPTEINFLDRKDEQRIRKEALTKKEINNKKQIIGQDSSKCCGLLKR